MSLIVGIPSTISELFLFIVVVRSQGCVIPGLEEAQEARLFPPRCGWGSTARGSGRRSREQQPGETGRRRLFISPQRLPIGALAWRSWITQWSASVQKFLEAQLSMLKLHFYLLRTWCFCVPICPTYFQMYLGKKNREKRFLVLKPWNKTHTIIFISL